MIFQMEKILKPNSIFNAENPLRTSCKAYV